MGIDWGDLAVLERVAVLGSFAKAADELGVSRSEVSRAVQRVEAQLGVSLLHRTTRRVVLTSVGSDVLARASRMAAEAHAIVADVAAHTDAPRGTVRLNGPVIFGERYLAPALPTLLRRWPELSVDLVLDDRFVDVAGEDWDVVVRVARLADAPGVSARKLASERRVVVASPAYLAAHGTPRVAADLEDHVCLRYALISVRDEWRLLGPDGAAVSPTVRGPLVVNHGGALHAAARDGLGIAVLPLFIVREDVRSGALVPVLERWTPPSNTAIWAVWPTGRERLPKVRAVVDWLVEALQDVSVA